MKDDRIYLLHIRDAIHKIFQYTKGGRQDFFKDTRTQDAVVRNLEITGEAVKNISTALKDAHPQVPGKRIAGMRDKIIHEYFGVNLELVWDVVQQDLRSFYRKVEELLTELGGASFIMNKHNRP